MQYSNSTSRCDDNVSSQMVTSFSSTTENRNVISFIRLIITLCDRHLVKSSCCFMMDHQLTLTWPSFWNSTEKSLWQLLCYETKSVIKMKSSDVLSQSDAHGDFRIASLSVVTIELSCESIMIWWLITMQWSWQLCISVSKWKSYESHKVTIVSS